MMKPPPDKPKAPRRSRNKNRNFRADGTNQAPQESSCSSFFVQFTQPGEIAPIKRILACAGRPGLSSLSCLAQPQSATTQPKPPAAGTPWLHLFLESRRRQTRRLSRPRREPSRCTQDYRSCPANPDDGLPVSRSDTYLSYDERILFCVCVQRPAREGSRPFEQA